VFLSFWQYIGDTLFQFYKKIAGTVKFLSVILLGLLRLPVKSIFFKDSNGIIQSLEGLSNSDSRRNSELGSRRFEIIVTQGGHLFANTVL
jgi:hypothetical protein